MGKTCVGNYLLRGGCKLSFTKRLRKFHSNEAGSITIFSFYLMMIMVIVGSLGLYIMRVEYRRTTVQYTMDRAILAAASLKQTIPPVDVVNDYFAKAHMDRVDTGIVLDPNIQVESSLNFRKVSVDTSITTSPILFGMFLDVDDITTPISATAIDGVSKVEVSLVLDVSGSMGRQSRLVNLKVAAKEFVDTLLLNQPEDDTYAITIVPFSTQVNAGADLLANYQVTNEHSYSNCIDFDGADFGTMVIPTDTLLKRTGHFAPWGTDQDPSWKLRVCPPVASRVIKPLSGNIAQLKAYIDSFVAAGNTSTDIGIKWGAALLDPTARPAVSNLIDNSIVEAKFRGRPYDYAKEGVLKVIVVMTDGKNTNQYVLRPEYSSGLSDVWIMKDQHGRTRYSIKDPDRDRWLYTSGVLSSRRLTDGSWQAQPERSDSTDVRRMPFTELFDEFSNFYTAYMLTEVDDNNDEFERDFDGRWKTVYSGIVKPGIKDVRMDNICTATKANGVLIFTIGFEVTDDNAAKLQKCATTHSHFFRVEGVEISEAFAAIATQLSYLRLTQ